MTEDVVPPPAKLTLKQRLKAHFAEYGRVAIWTYLTLSILTIIGFSIAIGIGFAPSSASGVFGVIGAGWVAAKATMPLRILATLGLTPLVATLLARRKKAAPPEDTDDAPVD
ncbi:MAG: FAM210 family protein [Myxococcota bacterium]|nr:FAM210 family protein [Myxococcota bacterium]